MYQAETGYPMEPVEKQRFDFSGWTKGVEERIPSLDKSLDRYFDQYMDSIVQEWELLTDYELISLEGRLKRITEELARLETGHATLKERAHVLDDSLHALEVRR
jgi:predicted nuclease with TOPRIM domain